MSAPGVWKGRGRMAVFGKDGADRKSQQELYLGILWRALSFSEIVGWPEQYWEKYAGFSM